MRRVLLIGATLALVLALPNGALAALSKGEFIRKGDALCLRVKRELAPIRVRAEAAQNLPVDAKWAAGADIWADQIRIQKRFVRDFRAIGAPPGDRRARELLSGLDRGIVLATRVQRAFAQRNTAALPTVLTSYLRFTTQLNQRVRAYGFRVCGR